MDIYTNIFNVMECLQQLDKSTLSGTQDVELTYLSTAMATKVKTEAETDIPCTSPLILHMLLPNGHPGREME